MKLFHKITRHWFSIGKPSIPCFAFAVKLNRNVSASPLLIQFSTIKTLRKSWPYYHLYSALILSTDYVSVATKHRT